ncbi:MAG: hypothetical protein ACM3X3_01785 [Betaproteobacteria bacterium]
MAESETRKQLAAGNEEQGVFFRASFDPFNMIMQRLGKLDDKVERLHEKIDTRSDELRQEIANATHLVCQAHGPLSSVRFVVQVVDLFADV